MNQTETNPRYSENALREKAFLSELNKKAALAEIFSATASSQVQAL